VVCAEVVMTSVKPNQITDQLNRCYLDYDPGWPTGIGNIRSKGFEKYIEETGGIQLGFDPEINKQGQWGYGVKWVKIVDEHKFTLWLLRWS
jgi:hypothetical protein